MAALQARLGHVLMALLPEHNLTLPCSALDNQFRMSILERLEQMERRMAEMTGSQQHKQGNGGGGSGSGNGGSQAQVRVGADCRLSWCLMFDRCARLSITSPFSAAAGALPGRGKRQGGAL